MGRRSLCALAFVAVALVALGAPAGAATSLSEPQGNPFVIPVDAAKNPVPFTIVAKGFPKGTLVYVEQCDGKSPTDAHWLITLDCDAGSSPSAAIVDAQGVASFNADDHNRAFRPIMGASPSGNFNCLAEGAPSPNNGLTDWHACSVRVSSNNTQPTSDQLFLPFVQRNASSSSSSAWVIVAIVAGVVVVILAAVFWFGRRRAAQTV